MRRFTVVEDSMLPGLRPGDLLFAREDPEPALDSLVIFPHPAKPGMWLVKRATAVAGGEAWVESDNPTVTTADSRTFGWVPTTSMLRVVARYRWPLTLTRPGRKSSP